MAPEQRAVAPKPKSAEERRFDLAIDMVLNSGTMYPYMGDFWAFVDGKITEAQARERFPS